MSARDDDLACAPGEPGAEPCATAALPPGTRLRLSVVAQRLGVGLRTLARPAGISVAGMSMLAGGNHWPKRISRARIEQVVRSELARAGATPAELETLFQAHAPHDHTGAAAEAAPLLIRDSEVTDVLLAKQTLGPAARKAFELFINPFDGEVESAEQMFTNGEIRFVREACWQAAINSRFVGVVGESGSGKTTLLADLKERIATDRKPTVVIEPSVLGMEDSSSRGTKLRATDILTAIITTLDPLATVCNTMERRTRQAERALVDSTTAGNTHLLLIEEAHSLPIATLKHLKRLHERMRLHGRKPMVGILLLGQPELRAKLDEKRHDVREVVQRIELVELQPLGNDLKPYLQHRARLAGKELTQLIDDGGIEALRERLTVQRPGVRSVPVSLLYPLAVNNMIVACLNAAAELGAPVVTRDVVRAV